MAPAAQRGRCGLGVAGVRLGGVALGVGGAAGEDATWPGCGGARAAGGGHDGLWRGAAHPLWRGGPNGSGRSASLAVQTGRAGR